MFRGSSPGGPRGSAGGFGRKSILKIVSDIEREKNTLIHVSAKTVFVSSPPTESRRMSSFHNFLSFNHYFKNILNYCLEKKCGYGNFNYGNILFSYPLAYNFGCGNFTKVARVCTDRL
jgi:hypothetical protein